MIKSSAKKWRKLGLIFEPGQHSWINSHAQNPLPELITEGVYRIYFASRDLKNRARGGFVTIDMKNPLKILEVSPSPCLDLGELGTFDDAGVMPSSLIDGEPKLLYYTGWSKAVDVPFAFHIGLAEAKNENQFDRVSKAPVLGRNHHDPFITGAPYVLKERGAFRMWYVSGTHWQKDSEAEKPKHFYTIKHADSTDGLTWRTSPDLCLSYENEEYAIARPVVWRDNDSYKMWFTYRGGEQTYRIGEAISADGLVWERTGQVGIDVSESGWDSEMICYAHPLFFQGQQYAVYNGNSYGQTGIGLAVCE